MPHDHLLARPLVGANNHSPLSAASTSTTVTLLLLSVYSEERRNE
jgi:hypothetical protein